MTSTTSTCFNKHSNKYKLTFDEWVNRYISVTWRVGKFSNTDRIDRWGGSSGETPIYFLYRIVDWVNERLGHAFSASGNPENNNFIEDVFFFYDGEYSDWSEDYNEDVYSPIGVLRIYNAYLESLE
jgi:hypothetical protein